ADKNDDGIIIASDTLVSLNGEVLGKPVDEADAFRMLRTLSGNTHEVFTGVTIVDAKSGKIETRSVRTGVCFRELSDDEIKAYIASSEPMDKAGAYGIQGGAGKFVKKLEGSYENVIGFPVDEVQDMLNGFLS
ncbi:MAG: septum formation protein Maf, partial [Clostridia bacterium]|nr:septum formation protein Maf [Clostridia bacterium]